MNNKVSSQRPLGQLPSFDTTRPQERAARERMTAAGLGWLMETPAYLGISEKLLLFALAVSIRPRRYLEIGTWYGGSAAIVARALDITGSDGEIFCVDPAPQIGEAERAVLGSRLRLIEGASPAALAEVAAMAEGPFDMVLIDGEHSRQAVRNDAIEVVPLANANAQIIFHDAFSADVAAGIDDAKATLGDAVIDLGILTREFTPNADFPDAVWGGMHVWLKR